MTQKVLIAVLLFAFGVLFFYKLGAAPLADYDEAIYAQVAKQAYVSGDQLGFEWLGNLGLNRAEAWFEKPPLMIWLIELAYAGFGVGEFAARFWVACLALASVWISYRWAYDLSGSFIAGILAASAYIFCSQYLQNASVLQFDIPAGFFILLSLYAFFKAAGNPRYYLLFGASLAAGVMIKSVIGFFPGIAALTYMILTWDFTAFKRRHFYWGIGIFLLLALPWHVAETLRFGRAFWNQYLFYHILSRYSGAIENNGRDAWFFWDILKTQSVFFYGFLSSVLYFLFQSARRHKAYLLPLLSALIIFGVFSFSQTKLPAYILVLYPVAAVMIGITVFAIIRPLPDWFGRYFSAAVVAGIAIVILIPASLQAVRLTRMNDGDLADKKVMGLHLKDNYADFPVYFRSSTGTSPEIIFYAGRRVDYLPEGSALPARPAVVIGKNRGNGETGDVAYRTPNYFLYEYPFN